MFSITGRATVFRKPAWFKMRVFWVTQRTVREPRRGQQVGRGARRVPSACEAPIAEHFQPVRMGLAGQQLGRTVIDAVGMLAAQEPAVVEKELQQREVVGAELSAEEEVVAESAVEVLD